MNHRAVAPRGAMTVAMNAAAERDAPRALRVGVLVGTRLVAERVFSAPATISLGRTERATIAVDDPDAPEHLELFALDVAGAVLFVDPRMRGRVSDGSAVREVGSLGASARIDARWRGRLNLGDVTVLFQFVARPAAAPRPQLPAAIRARPLGQLDWTWNACAAAFLALGMAGAAWAEYVYDPVVSDEAEDIRRMVRIMAEPTPTEAEPPPPSTAQGAAAEAPRPTNAAAADRPATRAPRAPERANGRDTGREVAAAMAAADRAANAARDAMNPATFAALTGALDRGGTTARDQLARAATQQTTLDDLRNTDGVAAHARPGINRMATRDPEGERGLCGAECLRAREIRNGAPAIASGGPPRERVIRPIEVPTEQPIDGVGEVDASVVAARIRAQLGGIRACYERGLRDNPALRGRLEVRFTLGENGRVARITSSGLAESPDVAACVSQRIRALAFPQPQGGSVDFMFPFVLDHQ